jgi:bile acid:Na+ symporter, BASS family
VNELPATIALNPTALWALKIALAMIVAAVALHLDRSSLDVLRRVPRAMVAGLISQWLVLPGLTLLLIVLWSPPPAVALGLLLVAACPGGNASNYYCLVARANPALSIALTTVSTVFTPLTLPLLFAVGVAILGLSATGATPTVAVVPLLLELMLILVLPLLLAFVLRRHAASLADRVRLPMRRLAGLMLVGIVVAGLVQAPLRQIDHASLWGLVAVHNALALAAGYGVGALARLAEAERRTLAFETGLQNAGLGLVIILTHLGGVFEMALVAAIWGLWHLVSGAGLALLWSRFPPEEKGA